VVEELPTTVMGMLALLGKTAPDGLIKFDTQRGWVEVEGGGGCLRLELHSDGWRAAEVDSFEEIDT
jgi:hypothetical protein